jgi:asparagine synthase (glutamine-hydrolysing)
MNQKLHHRGPDDSNLKVWDNIGLGHKRLWIIDEDGGRQPMESANGDLAIVYNGEIYNYIELRSQLIQAGYKPKTFSDTEVLLLMYEKYGRDMFQYLNGMFAFAILDRRKDQILLARDRFGEKPLYYYQDGQCFLFASEIKALLEHPRVQAEVNPRALHDYFTFQYCLNGRTLFKNIHRVLPAHYVLLNGEGTVLEDEEYWHMSFVEEHEKSESFFVDEARFLIEDAVKIRLRSDVPLGAYVSGGLDSSTVASMASKLMGKGVPAFTGYFGEDPKFSELQYAKIVATQNKSVHHTYCPTAQEFADSFQDLVYYMDEPAAGPGIFPQYMVSKLARKHVKVVLGGQGGDEIFGGYARYLMMYLEASIKGSIYGNQDPKSHVVLMDNIIPNLGMLQQYVPLLKRFWSKGLFDSVEERYYALISRILDLNQLLTPEVMAMRDEERIFSDFKNQFNDVLRKLPKRGTALLNRMLSYDIRTSLQSLLHVEDRVSMANSLESRLPFLDHRLVELMFRTPATYKFNGGKSKALLLNAVQHLLPGQVLNRKDKMGFPTPFVEWARGPLNDFVRDILLSKKARERGIYRSAQIEQMIDQSESFGREVWGLLNLEMWYQTFVDQS